MKKLDIAGTTKKVCKNVKTTASKNAPEILLVVGVIGTVAAAIMASKASISLKETVERNKNAIDETKKALPLNEANKPSKERVSALSKDYAKFGLDLVKLYGPAVAVETLSIGCIFGSNKIMRKRSAELLAAFASVNTAYSNYRKNVIDTYGKDADIQMLTGMKKETVETVSTLKNGKEKVTTEEALVKDTNSDIPNGSLYAKFFDSASREWTKDPEYNLNFLLAREHEANVRLKAQGHLFLNEVYDMLDIPRTTAGQYVGWIFDKECPCGDNEVNFGLYDAKAGDWAKPRFINGYEPVVLLDFNVDGVIVDKI